MPARSSDARLILVTAPDQEVAGRLAEELVRSRLAACVNLVAGVKSVYRWQGEVREDQEVLLIVKSRRERVAQLEAWVREHHPYDVPELVALTPEHVQTGYLRWLLDACAPDGEGQGA